MAIADGERNGEVRFFGEISAELASMVAKLAKGSAKLHFCCEAGSTSYDHHRQITGLGMTARSWLPRLFPDVRATGSRLTAAMGWRGYIKLAS